MSNKKTIYVLGAELHLRDEPNAGQVIHEMTHHPEGKGPMFNLEDGGWAFVSIETNPPFVYVSTPSDERS